MIWNIHPNDVRLLQWVIDTVREMQRGTDKEPSYLARIEHLERWRSGIRVEGASYFSNSPMGMQISIPRAPRIPPASPIPDLVRWLKVTTDDDGGKYLGRISRGRMTGADGTLALPDGMTYPDEDDCLIENEEEDGQETHWLKKPSYVLGRYTGRVAEGDNEGLAIYAIQCGNPRTADPADFTELPEDETEADTHTWDRRNADSEGDDRGDVPLLETYVTRFADSEADEEGIVTRYIFTATRLLDASGKVVARSAETRAEFSKFKAPCEGE